LEGDGLAGAGLRLRRGRCDWAFVARGKVVSVARDCEWFDHGGLLSILNAGS